MKDNSGGQWSARLGVKEKIKGEVSYSMYGLECIGSRFAEFYTVADSVGEAEAVLRKEPKSVQVGVFWGRVLFPEGKQSRLNLIPFCKI